MTQLNVTKLLSLIVLSTVLSGCDGSSDSGSSSTPTQDNSKDSKAIDNNQKNSIQDNKQNSQTTNTETTKTQTTSHSSDVSALNDNGSNISTTNKQPTDSKISSAKGTCTSYTKEQILAAINKARSSRRSCGSVSFAAAKPVSWNTNLELAAKDHAEDIAKNEIFSHTGSDGSEPAERVTRNGYSYRVTGENIAYGHPTIEDAINGWIKSSGHCRNLMNSKYEETAMVCVYNPKGKYKNYWVQTFGAQLR